MWKFNWKTGKDKWLLMIAGGLLLLVICIPVKRSGTGDEKDLQMPTQNSEGWGEETGGMATGETIAVGAPAAQTYEAQLEARVKEILKTVAGVGTVDVMIVLKSSEEKVIRIDKKTGKSSTEEKDSQGGSRSLFQEDSEEATILMDDGGGDRPIVEKEIKPEISGIIISAQGGGDATVKAEISSAMEALFDLPLHKIKVLKRME